MITKILFTLSVLVVVWFVFRPSGRSSRLPGSPQRQALPASDLPRSSSKAALLYVVPITMVVATGIMVYFEWRSSFQVVQVRVVNSNTGRVAHYRVQRGDINERSFETVDGQWVQLAQVERLEVGKVADE